MLRFLIVLQISPFIISFWTDENEIIGDLALRIFFDMSKCLKPDSRLAYHLCNVLVSLIIRVKRRLKIECDALRVDSNTSATILVGNVDSPSHHNFQSCTPGAEPTSNQQLQPLLAAGISLQKSSALNSSTEIPDATTRSRDAMCFPASSRVALESTTEHPATNGLHPDSFSQVRQTE